MMTVTTAAAVETPRGRPVPAANAANAPNGQPSQDNAQGNTTAPSTAPPADATGKKAKGRKSLADETREWHPSLNVKPEIRPDGGTSYVASTPLEKAPEDFDEEKYIPLRRLDFVDDAAHLEYKADRLQKQADQLRSDAVELRKLGSREEQENMRKLQTMLRNIEEMKEKFESKDIDFSKIMEKMQAKLSK
jgi:hypothetical protein